MSNQQTFPRLSSLGQIATRWQKSVAVVERHLAEVGAVPVVAINDVRFYDADIVDRALLKMIEAAQAGPIIHGEPTGPVKFHAVDDDDDLTDDDAPEPPPQFGGRLGKILGGVNRG